MDSINEKIGDPFSEKSLIPSVEEAPKLAEASLKKYGGLPKDDRLEYVAPHYLNQYNLKNGENKQIAGLNTQVKYVQIINSSPVSGARINLDLGENGEILAIWKDWITSYTQTREIKIITVRTAYENLLTKGTVDKIQGNIPQGTKVTNITLGYYWTGDVGSSLEPIWIFYVVFPDESIRSPLMVDASA